MLLDPKQFRRCFLAWVRVVSQLTHRQIVAMDGKKLRRSQDRGGGKQALSLVSAWATANGVVLAQLKVHAKSDEMKVIPELLKMLDLTGCIVTLDALNCQTKIAAQITAQNAEYTRAVKENRGSCMKTSKTCLQVASPKTSRRLAGKRTRGIRYYMSSSPNPARRLLASVRKHWRIENQLHWILDVAFREDESRMRTLNSPENFALVRQVAYILLKQEQTAKIGLKAKRLKAACDRDYLVQVLSI